MQEIEDYWGLRSPHTVLQLGHRTIPSAQFTRDHNGEKYGTIHLNWVMGSVLLPRYTQEENTITLSKTFPA
jgi:hypothetical protein